MIFKDLRFIFSKNLNSTYLRNISFYLLLVVNFGVFGQAIPFTIILGRPTDTSITASIRCSQHIDFYLEYGKQPGVYNGITPTLTNSNNVPDEIDMANLDPNTKYYYRMRWRLSGNGSFSSGGEHFFHTQRAPGSTFRFEIEADEHLYDKKGIYQLYQVTLANQAKDSADFMMSLGDIFGDDHTPDITTSADMDSLHLDYVKYLSEVCHSMPFYVCLGNHEGESGYYLEQTPPNNIAVYGTLWRKYYYPNPYPNGFYSGNMTAEQYGIGLPENYYAWTWGDALFVVLDVYRECDVDVKPEKWDWTLGDAQYNWLKNTLTTSTAKYKFVFAHHTRGQGRGGSATATEFEWGGYDNGVYKFDQYRPGWGKPIHQLMVDNGVNIFFQGHDHLYAKEVLDGLVYQETPMPADTTYEIGVLANADAYTDITMDGSGYLRVTVKPSCVTVDYIKSYRPQDTLDGIHHNYEVAYSYSIGDCTTATDEPKQEDQTVIAFPNPANDILTVQSKNVVTYLRKVELFNVQGHLIQSQTLLAGQTLCQFDLKDMTSGFYFVKLGEKVVKIVK